MARLEDLGVGASVTGLAPSGLVKIVNVEWFGDQVLKAISEDSAGQFGSRLVYRADEPPLELARRGPVWSFDGDGELFHWV